MGKSPGNKDISPSQSEALRMLPAVEELLETDELAGAAEKYGRQVVVDSARAVLERLRSRVLAGEEGGPVDASTGSLAAAIAAEAAALAQPSLKPLVNATGVVVHTNLGRSLLPAAAIEAVVEVSAHYSNLEFDLKSGARGSRHSHIAGIIKALTGAEDALVVNNNAAAVLLALTVFGWEKEVVVSRGELVEIGGSFRIPEIMAASAARLVEVGTTNKTRLADYEKAIGPETAMLLHIHTSNYAVVGFTAEVSIGELAELGHARGLIVADDLGSGALAELPALADEPSVRESLEAGADIVTFSGDKLLGGPQAGIIVGGAEAVGRMRSHPMARAIRVDKMTLAALQATLALYLKPEEAIAKIPTLRLLSEEPSAIEKRAIEMAAELGKVAGAAAAVAVEKAASKVGGGALPLLELDSYVCAVSPAGLSVDDLAARLRRSDPPVIGRIHKDRLLLDARTVLPEQVAAVGEAFRQALG